MYETGDAKISRVGDDEDDYFTSPSSDAKSRLYPIPDDRYPVVYLPHSCREWVIGGAYEVRLMIKDVVVDVNEGLWYDQWHCLNCGRSVDPGAIQSRVAVVDRPHLLKRYAH